MLLNITSFYIIECSIILNYSQKHITLKCVSVTHLSQYVNVMHVKQKGSR